MKDILLILIISFISVMIFSSCKKENITSTSTILDTIIVRDTTKTLDTVPGPMSITGFYIGKIGSNTDYPSFQMAFLFRSNGTVRAYNNILSMPGNVDTSDIPPAEGTYIVSHDTITTHCIYLYDTTNTFSTLAIVNSDSTYMEGAWGSGMSIGSGFFFVYKKY
jgi:hypothetical protein